MLYQIKYTMSLIKNFYHDLICEQQNPEYDQYNYDVLAEQEYFEKKMHEELRKTRENNERTKIN